MAGRQPVDINPENFRVRAQYSRGPSQLELLERHIRSTETHLAAARAEVARLESELPKLRAQYAKELQKTQVIPQAVSTPAKFVPKVFLSALDYKEYIMREVAKDLSDNFKKTITTDQLLNWGFSKFYPSLLRNFPDPSQENELIDALTLRFLGPALKA